MDLSHSPSLRERDAWVAGWIQEFVAETDGWLLHYETTMQQDENRDPNEKTESDYMDMSEDYDE